MRLLVLSVVVGISVGVAATGAGSAGCDGSAVGGAVRPEFGDPVCHELVRTLGQRMGVVAAVATLVIVLTTLGLSRLQDEGLAAATRPRGRN